MGEFDAQGKGKSLEAYFSDYKKNIIGDDIAIHTPFGQKKMVYADWTASGRLYRPIEERLMDQVGPLVANTHTKTTTSGEAMTHAYHLAKEIIKKQVGALKRDVLISSNSGMTGVVNKFQRILGLKIHEKYRPFIDMPQELVPIVFVSHMEHHSNQTTWLETVCDVEIIQPNEEGNFSLDNFKKQLKKYKKRKLKIAAITSCSNVTGIFTPYHEVAEIIHNEGGYCFVDFAASAPYIPINMHPKNKKQNLDAIYFSPHKFLGGPGGTGCLIFDSKLYKNRVPDNPGGGTVDWTDPWGEHKYIEEIEAREDGGTPAFLQTIKVAMAMQLKENMGLDNIKFREQQLSNIVWKRLPKIKDVKIFADNNKVRLPIFSFIIEGLHYNLAVQLLNDKFGVQTRGGCSCAGTYGHFLFEMSQQNSTRLKNKITFGDLSEKPGWVRMSLHPTMTDGDVHFIMDAIEEVALNYKDWSKDYDYNAYTNDFSFKGDEVNRISFVEDWFEF